MGAEYPVKTAKKVPNLISPFVLVVLESKKGTSEKIDVQRVRQCLLKEWIDPEKNSRPDKTWNEFARENHLLLDNEDITFLPDEYYTDGACWATIRDKKKKGYIVEMYLGHCVDKNDTTLPTIPDVAKHVQRIVPNLVNSARGNKFWRSVTRKAEIMINRDESKVVLKNAPTWLESFSDADAKGAVVTWLTPVVGGVIPLLNPNNLSNFPNAVLNYAKLVVPVIIGLWIILATIRWFLKRSKLSWELMD
ncbi:MAG: hypothetical protein HND47_12920 [Chloroflexi bacterium]|nr:hypothetical protein [Chloroflexota bacterium]